MWKTKLPDHPVYIYKFSSKYKQLKKMLFNMLMFHFIACQLMSELEAGLKVEELGMKSAPQ